MQRLTCRQSLNCGVGVIKCIGITTISIQQQTAITADFSDANRAARQCRDCFGITRIRICIISQYITRHINSFFSNAISITISSRRVID